MTRHRPHPATSCGLALIFFLLSGSRPLAAGPDGDPAENGPSDFVRFVENEEGAQVQAAVVTYENGDGVRVHLVSALHIGEKSYYEGLSRLFEDHDAVLYELIGGERAPAPGERGDGLISLLQRWLKDTLELEFQLDAIDYRRDNFVHADMDAETFLRLQRERGESLLTLLLHSLRKEMVRQQAGKDSRHIGLVDLVRVFLSQDRAREMKILLGRQFEDIEARLAGLGGEEGSVILTERNKVAISVLEKTLTEGDRRNISIFYGAGHMPDLEERITTRLGFRRIHAEWRVAWDMPRRRDSAGNEDRIEEAPPHSRRKAWF